MLNIALCDLVSGRVRVAVRLRPQNAEEMVADADFADCVELQPEVQPFDDCHLFLFLYHSTSWMPSLDFYLLWHFQP